MMLILATIFSIAIVVSAIIYVRYDFKKFIKELDRVIPKFTKIEKELYSILGDLKNETIGLHVDDLIIYYKSNSRFGLFTQMFNVKSKRGCSFVDWREGTYKPSIEDYDLVISKKSQLIEAAKNYNNYQI